MHKIKFIQQYDQMDCGPACLAMIAKYYGKEYSIQHLRESSYTTKDGVSVQGIREAANSIGLDTVSAKLTIENIANKDTWPCILHWNQNHFVVLYGIKHNFFTGLRSFLIADPAFGLLKIDEEAFKSAWISNSDLGIAVLLKPREDFYSIVQPKIKKTGWKDLFKHALPYKKQVVQLISALLAGSILTLFFPFLTQKLVDNGVNHKNFSVVFTILLAQLFLYLGSVSIEVVRNWTMLFVGTRVNISIVSSFFKKIFSLPVRYFDTKLTGDFNQRINDQDRIEKFLTSQTLFTLFSTITFIVFLGVLLSYDWIILLVYSALTLMAILWSIVFMDKRRFLDYQKFKKRSENQEAIYEIISGIQDIKLNNFEEYKRREWETVQIKLFGINLKILKVDQLQILGFDSINQLKNIFVTYLAAQKVISGNITLGTMLSITYIIGQMNNPITQLMSFFRSFQDAKISLERLDDVQMQKEEEELGQVKVEFKDYDDSNSTIGSSLDNEGIHIKNLSFQYEGPKSQYVLRDLDLFIPKGKTTAIVGESGSGKTTLMKILLKFYAPTIGSIVVDNIDLSSISPESWRRSCGVVMQEGYIFSDTIERNIITADTKDQYRFNTAVHTANIIKFLVSLPLRENTKIGAGGMGISGGQKQRLLIARAVYKSPHFIFFDEATSSLDADNEKVIQNNLQEFFLGKTVVMIAHRLSTVRNADQIIVLKDGRIVESGTHSHLVSLQGNYFNLVKNQLELSA